MAVAAATVPLLEESRAVRQPTAFWRRFARNRGAVVGLSLLAVVIGLSAIGPEFAANPTQQNVRDRFQPPNSQHWFGTDEVGRDIFSRVVNGGRISILSAVAAVLIGLGCGTAIGLIAGFHEGRIGLGMMAIIDMLLALPAILLAITIAARMGPGLSSAMFAAALVGLPAFARLARASTLTVKRQEFVEAARSLGVSNWRIMGRHVLPNILTPLVVQGTIGIGNAILLVSALGYLGLGAQPPAPEWGRMLSDAQRYILNASCIGIFPGLGIALTVIGFNLAGDGLRDALDPVAK